jgi:hypothetical protein
VARSLSPLAPFAPLALFALVVLAGIGGGALLTACPTDAETPNAYFGRDGGPGDEGQPCRSTNQCNAATLVCVDEDGNGPATPLCRETCQTTDNDPCGPGALCVGISGQGSSGACLPAPGAGESCTGRCDDGLVCIQGAGGDSTCRVACTDDNDCPNNETCNASQFCE